MKSRTTPTRVSIPQLYELFTQTSKHTMQLNPFVGQGCIHFFNLEEGLLARLWDCSFEKGLEVFHPPHADSNSNHFSLVYLCKITGITLTGCTKLLPELRLRDRLFFGAGSDYKLSVAPCTRVQCLTISISAEWLMKAVEHSKEMQLLWEQITATDNIFKADVMTAMEGELLQEIFALCNQNSMGTFGIRTLVLRIVTDFLHTALAAHHSVAAGCSHNTVANVEAFLCAHVTGPLPDLKTLSGMFEISESTLQRHFKKQYGLTLSAYFTGKKMEYARTAIQEKGISLAEAARLVGYRSIHKFTAMYHKHFPDANNHVYAASSITA